MAGSFYEDYIQVGLQKEDYSNNYLTISLNYAYDNFDNVSLSTHL